MPFADDLINASTAHTLTRAIEAAAPDRGRASALRAAAATLDRDRSLRLRERADLLRDALLADLPGDLASLDATVRAAATGRLPFHGWLIWPVTDAVATRAVAEGTGRAVDAALDLLAGLTGRLSAEFALRVLLNHDLDRTLDRIAGWTGSPDVDVRRLASEGTRPYLPWATRVGALLARPEATLPILDLLYRDDSAYVRRSVANHLNALRLLGHPPADHVHIDGPVLDSPTLPFDGELTFSARLTNTGPDPIALVVDYRVHHLKANGRRTPKTFRLTNRTLDAGRHLDIRRTHSFRPITTRRYHPGTHALDLQVNGSRTEPVEFTLLPPAG